MQLFQELKAKKKWAELALPTPGHGAFISATDMVRLSFSAYGADARAVDAMLDHEFSIEKVMSTELTTLNTSQKVRDAATALSGGGFHSIPVVDDPRLIGIEAPFQAASGVPGRATWTNVTTVRVSR